MLDAIEPFLCGAGQTAADGRVLATVLWAEIRGGADDGAQARAAEREVAWFKGHLTRMGPTSFAATFDGPARAVRAAARLVSAASSEGRGLAIGLHTGECEIAPAGVNGPAVDMARDLAALAPAGEVLVSRTVTDLVAGAGLAFEPAPAEGTAAAPRPWSFAR